MPSLSASIFGFATGIAVADKIDVDTSKHAARLMKSRRRLNRNVPAFVMRFTRKCPGYSMGGSRASYARDDG